MIVGVASGAYARRGECPPQMGKRREAGMGNVCESGAPRSYLFVPAKIKPLCGHTSTYIIHMILRSSAPLLKTRNVPR